MLTCPCCPHRRAGRVPVQELHLPAEGYPSAAGELRDPHHPQDPPAPRQGPGQGVCPAHQRAAGTHACTCVQVCNAHGREPQHPERGWCLSAHTGGLQTPSLLCPFSSGVRGGWGLCRPGPGWQDMEFGTVLYGGSATGRARPQTAAGRCQAGSERPSSPCSKSTWSWRASRRIWTRSARRQRRCWPSQSRPARPPSCAQSWRSPCRRWTRCTASPASTWRSECPAPAQLLGHPGLGKTGCNSWDEPLWARGGLMRSGGSWLCRRVLPFP